MLNNDEIRLAGIVRESIVDGPGYRFTVFVQGCPHHCEGCHNPATHSFEGGQIVTVQKLFEEVKKGKLLKGITLSGGEPFCQALPLTKLAELSHDTGLDVIAYSGYTFEELLANATEENGRMKLLQNIDYLIDGRFVLAERSLLLPFRGSKNQRILDMKQSLANGSAVIADL